MLIEIDEKDATGETARIYAELRRLWGVPYVSAIHRHMATRTGVLEWAWDAVGPVFRDGSAQAAGWRAADGIALADLDPIPREALAVWGVDDAALAIVKGVAEGFMRVAPINMMFAGLVKALLEGRPPGAAAGRSETAWSPPAPLPQPPVMIAPDALGVAERPVLMRFATPSGGRPFVPGMWRMLAHWPGLLAHLATVLGPRVAAPAMLAACDEVRARVDAAVPDVLARLPAIETRHPMPGIAERDHFLSVGATYRKTSPELIVLGRLVRGALP